MGFCNVFEIYNYEYVKFDMWSIRAHQISKRMKYIRYESLHSSLGALVLYINEIRNLLSSFCVYDHAIGSHFGKISPDSCLSQYIYHQN